MIQLAADENLIAVFRKHNFYFAVKIFSLIILALLPLFLYPVLLTVNAIAVSGINYLLLFFYVIFITLLWITGFVFWTNYYLDIWILTDKSLIDVEQIGLFSREVATLRLDKIQDIKVEVSGILDTMLHIGTVHVQTAGNEKEFVIPQVDSPDQVKDLIQSACNN